MKYRGFLPGEVGKTLKKRGGEGRLPFLIRATPARTTVVRAKEMMRYECPSGHRVLTEPCSRGGRLHGGYCAGDRWSPLRVKKDAAVPNACRGHRALIEPCSHGVVARGYCAGDRWSKLRVKEMMRLKQTLRHEARLQSVNARVAATARCQPARRFSRSSRFMSGENRRSRFKTPAMSSVSR